MAASKTTRFGVLALASALTLAAVWHVNERDKRLSGAASADASADTLPGGARGRAGADAENWLDVLRRIPIAAQTAGDLFSSSTWAPPPAPPLPAVKPVETPPPFAFVYLGKSLLDGTTRVYLTKAVPANSPPGPVFMVASGETLDGAYRVDSVTDDSISVTYLPMNKPQTLAFASLVAAALPASAAGGPASMNFGPATPQAFVPQPLVSAPASVTAPSSGQAPSGGFAPAGAAASSAVASAGTSGATATSSISGGSAGSAAIAATSTGGTSSAINPGATPSGILGSLPIGSGVIGTSVTGTGPIGSTSPVAPDSFPTGSSATVGPEPAMH